MVVGAREGEEKEASSWGCKDGGKSKENGGGLDQGKGRLGVASPQTGGAGRDAGPGVGRMGGLGGGLGGGLLDKAQIRTEANSISPIALLTKIPYV